MVEEDTEFVTFDGDTVTKSEYRDEIINKYRVAELNGLTKITDFEIGSEAYHISDLMASLMLEHREQVDTNYRMSMIYTAEGEFLDNFGDPAGVHRYGATPSEGEVTFTRLNQDNTDTIKIRDGSQVSTEDAISFILDNDGADLVLGPEVKSASCNVICEQEGAYTNVLPGTVNLIMNDLASLLSVTNNSAMTGGRDIEEDEDYRSRILLSPYAVPAGTLKWYENTSLTASHYDEEEEKEVFSVHDVKVEKGVTQGEADIKIIYDPVDWSDTSLALDDLTDLFAMKEYNAAGVTLDFILCSPVSVLTGENVVYFALLLEANYSLDMVKSSVIEKITQFNEDALIEVEFNPGSLASIIENEIEGIDTCRIVEYDSTNERYIEIVEPITLEENEKYVVDLTDIESRIREMRFNLDIELEE
jgi:hypothetical protein